MITFILLKLLSEISRGCFPKVAEHDVTVSVKRVALEFESAKKKKELI